MFYLFLRLHQAEAGYEKLRAKAFLKKREAVAEDKKTKITGEEKQKSPG